MSSDLELGDGLFSQIKKSNKSFYKPDTDAFWRFHSLILGWQLEDLEDRITKQESEAIKKMINSPDIRDRNLAESLMKAKEKELNKAAFNAVTKLHCLKSTQNTTLKQPSNVINIQREGSHLPKHRSE
jgi:hypothetical protein